MKFLAVIILLVSCQTRNKIKLKLTATQYIGKASKLMSMQNFDKAKDYLDDCIKHYPKNKSCHWEQGWVYYAKGDWQKNVHHWEISHKISPLKRTEFEYLIEARNMQHIHNKISELTYNELPKRKYKNLIEINSVGDVMMGSDFPKADFPSKNKSNLFINVENHLSKDAVNFLNLEGPLCNQGKSLKCNENDVNKCYSFRSPTKFSSHLLDKFNVASIANNHIMDFGHNCYQETVKTLNSVKIKSSDGFGNFAEINKDIALISFYTHEQYDYNLLNIPQSFEQVKALSKKYKIVIVSFHGGAEGHRHINIPFKAETYKKNKRGNVHKFATRMIDAGADLVIGHGPHVVRAMHIYKRKLIAFSLGNFFTFGRFNLLGNQKHGLILKAYLDAKNGDFKSGQLISTVQKDGELLMDKRHIAAKLIMALSKIDFKQNKFIFNEDFRFLPSKSLK